MMKTVPLESNQSVWQAVGWPSKDVSSWFHELLKVWPCMGSVVKMLQQRDDPAVSRRMQRGHKGTLREKEEVKERQEDCKCHFKDRRPARDEATQHSSRE